MPIADYRAQQVAVVQVQKAKSLEAMSYTVDGSTYHVTLGVQDQVNVQFQLSVLQQAPAGTKLVWEVVNNVFVQWGVEELGALLQAGLGHIQAAYGNAAQLIAALNAATTIAAIAAVDPTSGWPA